MKKAIAVLNIGGRSFNGKSRRSFEAAAKRWGCDLKEFRQPIVPGRHPYWQKPLICRELSDYDRVLQLDGDMLIRWNSPSPFDLVPEDHLGLVSADQFEEDNKRGSKIKQYRQSVVARWAKRLGVPEIDDKYHANAGFFLYSPKHHQWLWDELVELGISVNNQSTLLPEQANFSMLVQRREAPVVWLPKEWNLMVFRSGRRGHCMHNVMAGHIYHFLGGKAGRPKLRSTKWFRASAADDAWMRMPKEGGASSAGPSRSTSTASTRPWGDPLCSHWMKASIASALPQASPSTRPSARLRIHPVTPSSAAAASA